jgi:hypothetical protein
MHKMNRHHQLLLIGTLLPLCWLLMQVVHEAGHILAAWATGGEIARVVLHPLAISRTDMAMNPWPLLVVWAGPLVGVLIPVLTLTVFKLARLPLRYPVRFFAGFCLIANGAYIGIGSFSGVGDAGEMLRHGAPMWCLLMFGAITLPSGLFLWHGLGRYFGLGPSDNQVEPRAAYVCAGLLLLTVLIELTLSGV